jgi:hypothetical protein
MAFFPEGFTQSHFEEIKKDLKINFGNCNLKIGFECTLLSNLFQLK